MAGKKYTKRTNRKKGMRKRKGGKKSNFRVTQSGTVNPYRPKPQVFKKTVINAVYITGATAAVNTVAGALVSSMPEFSTIALLYNRYKFLKCTYTFNCQSTAGGPLTAFDCPRMWVRYNYDSNLASAGVKDKIQESPNSKMFQFTYDKTTFKYSFYPRCIEPVYLSSVLTGYKLAKQQYIDVQYSTVPHYGIMWFIDYLQAGVSISYDISWEVAFKYQD